MRCSERGFGDQIHLGSLLIPSIHTRTLVMVRRLLYNFGHLIRSLAIQFSFLGQICHKKLFTLICKYCFETIENVVIRNEPICEEYLNFTGRIFLNGKFAVEIFDTKVIYRNQRQKHTRWSTTLFWQQSHDTHRIYMTRIEYDTWHASNIQYNAKTSHIIAHSKSIQKFIEISKLVEVHYRAHFVTTKIRLVLSVIF